MAQTWTQEQLIQLRDSLVKYFSDDELRDLCFSLSASRGLEELDYDSLPAQGRAAKARELVAYVGRHNCIPALVKTCRELRPDVDWLSTAVPAHPPLQTEPEKPAAGSQTPSISTASKQPPFWRGCKPDAIVTIISATLGFAGVVIAAYLGYMGIKWQVEAPIRATQVAEVRLTQLALSATPTATSTSTPSPTPSPSSTLTPMPTPTPLVTATVRLDELAIPAGWISGGITPTSYISVTSCTGHYAGSGCQQWTYKTGGQWGSVLWWPLGCGFDKLQTCGINVLERGMFGTVNRLTFWARGDKGGEIIEFKIGGGDALPKSVRSRKATLESDWRQYEIDLTGLDLTNASGLFIWAAADQENPRGAVFYLDSILFEGHRR